MKTRVEQTIERLRDAAKRLNNLVIKLEIDLKKQKNEIH
jgi:hypothetical protein